MFIKFLKKISKLAIEALFMFIVAIVIAFLSPVIILYIIVKVMGKIYKWATNNN